MIFFSHSIFILFFADVTVRYIRGLPHVTVPLPSRNEKCQFALRPVSHNVGDFLLMLRAEDKGIDRAAVLNRDGIRIAAACSIENLMDEDFWWVINLYDFRFLGHTHTDICRMYQKGRNWFILDLVIYFLIVVRVILLQCSKLSAYKTVRLFVFIYFYFFFFVKFLCAKQQRRVVISFYDIFVDINKIRFHNNFFYTVSSK